jgi:ACT domain-containing protein
MKKGTLAIIEFEKFYRRELRIPTCEEFKQMGYSRASYYRVRDLFYEMKKGCECQEAAINVR